MPRSQDFFDGYRRAARDAMKYLEERASEMNDPHARRVLDVARDHMGKTLKRRSQGFQPPSKPMGNP